MKSARRTRPLPIRTTTVIGVPAPLHLPAPYVTMAPDRNGSPTPPAPNTTSVRGHFLIDADDTVVVDIEIAPDGQAYIERLP